MKEDLYTKEVQCPVCNNFFKTQKVKTSAIRIKKRDTDFCVYYDGINPIFYGVYVCPNCGYAALENVFQDITPMGKQAIKEGVSTKWVQRDYGGERTLQEAIDVYKLALLCGQLINQKKGIMGSICLRLAWLYRYAGETREQDFLQYAANFFEEAYYKEGFPIGSLDDTSVTYLLGEVYRRLAKYEKAINWFNKAISTPGIKQKRNLEIQAREQWSLARQQYKKQQEEQVG